MLSLEGSDLGNRDLEVRRWFEQERLELGVGLVDFVNQQHGRPVAGNRTEQRTRQDKALGKKHLVLRRDPIDRLGQSFAPAIASPILSFRICV